MSFEKKTLILGWLTDRERALEYDLSVVRHIKADVEAPAKLPPGEYVITPMPHVFPFGKPSTRGEWKVRNFGAPFEAREPEPVDEGSPCSTHGKDPCTCRPVCFFSDCELFANLDEETGEYLCSFHKKWKSNAEEKPMTKTTFRAWNFGAHSESLKPCIEAQDREIAEGLQKMNDVACEEFYDLSFQDAIEKVTASYTYPIEEIRASQRRICAVRGCCDYGYFRHQAGRVLCIDHWITWTETEDQDPGTRARPKVSAPTKDRTSKRTSRRRRGPSRS
jgi:hypothetical protein